MMEAQQHNQFDSEIPTLKRDTENEFVPAGFWIRWGASILDGLIVGIMLLPINIVNQILVHKESKAGYIVGTLVYYLAYFAIAGYFISKKGGLPGKLILGLKIVDLETGFFPTPGKAIFRETLGKLLSTITFMIGYIMAGFRKDKRGLHDLVASTQVLRKVKK